MGNGYETIAKLLTDRSVRRPWQVDVIRAYCGSILDPENNTPQVLWLISQGCDGKSVFTSALSQAMRELHLGPKSSWPVELKRNMRITSDERQALLLIDAYCRKPDIFRYGLGKLKNLSAKVLVHSNQPPILEYGMYNVIPIDWHASDEYLRKEGLMYGNGGFRGDNAFRERVFNEMPAFLKDCEEAYKRLCPDRGLVRVPTEILENYWE